MPTQNTSADKQTPHDLDAEEAVLGALQIDPETIGRLAGSLRPSDFYRERNGAIYAAMVDLYQRGARLDLSAVVAELDRQGKINEVGGAAYLAELVNACPTAAHAAEYAGRIERAAILRRVIQAAGRIAQAAYEQPVNLDELFQLADSALYEVRQSRQSGKIITPGERAQAAYDRYERRAKGERDGLAYGLLALDRWTQGAEPGQLILVAGRPAMGKSSLLQNIAENMAAAGYRVLFASAEMTEAQLTDRFVAAELAVSVHYLQEGNYSQETWQRIGDVLGGLSEQSWYSTDESDLTTGGLRSRAIEMRSQHGLDAIFVDYLQILHDAAGRGGEVERVTRISRELKRLARNLKVPVIAAAQLSRAVESRENKRPTLADLRESGALEQDADLVAFIFRPGYYSKDLNDNRAELIIAKQRTGPAGITANLIFDRRATRFRDATDQPEGNYAR